MDMKKTNILAVTAAASVFAATALADTILWYRFDGSGDTVVNAANPGFMDGKLKSIKSGWGSSGYEIGDDSAKFPVRGEAAFPGGFTVYDPVGGTNCPAPHAMSWSNEAHYGFVVAEDASGLHTKKTMTVEAFFRIKPGAVSRGNKMHPIVNCGWDDKYGYMMSVMDGKPFVRIKYLKKDGSFAGTGGSLWLANAARSPADPLPTNILYDGKWHHMAFTVNDSGTVKLYLDYMQVASANLSNYAGLYFDNTAPNCDIFQVGATLQSNLRSLWGDIAEVRISDAVLDPASFLRPVQVMDGVTDDDTFFYLPLGNLAWFAQPSQAGYTNAVEWIAPYLPLPGSSCRPSMIRSTTASVMPEIPTHVDDVAISQLRDGICSGTMVTNSGSMRFFRKSNIFINTSNGNEMPREVGSAISVPVGETIQTNDFTMEFFFRQPTKMSSTTNTTATIVYSPWVKICINQTDGRLLTRPFCEDGGKEETYYKNLSTSGRVDDDKWHHYAFVWEQETSNAVFFIDYKCIGSIVVSNGLQHTAQSTVFNIGSEVTVNSQAFGGFLDDVRLTRRILRPHEFLTSRVKQGPENVLFHARFENDHSAGVGSDIVGDGTPRKINGYTGDKCKVPEFRSHGRNSKVFADGGLSDPVPNAGYLRLDGGEVYWPHNSLLDRSRFTVEFFAAFNVCSNGSNLIRLSPGYNSAHSNPYGEPSIPVWGIYTRRRAGESLGLMFVTLTSTNIAQRMALNHPNADDISLDLGRKDLKMEVGDVMQDGRWHHWAITFDVTEENNMLCKVWCDYETVFEIERKGLLNVPLHGSVLEIGGTGNNVALVHGSYDEIRITAGVLPPEKFMRRGRPGFMFICR